MSDIIIPNGHMNLQWFWDHLGSDNPASTALGVRYVEGDTDPSDAFDTMEAMWAEVRPNLPVSTVLRNLKVSIKSPGNDLVVYERPESLPGTSVQSAVIPQSAVLFRKRTPFAGRKYRGRMYFPAPLAIDCNPSGIIETTSWSESAAAFLEILESAVWVQAVVLFHTSSGSDVPPTALLPSPYGLYAERYVATQRRRLRRTSQPAPI